MPIRPELRHLYRGPAWAAIRARILARAGHACERCGKPHAAKLRVTRGGIWYDDALSSWRNDAGEANGFNYPGITGRTVYVIRCVITIAHLDHDPRNNADANLAALCQHCHLKHDTHFHHANARRTRAANVGQAWLSREIEEGVRP
ncbi:MAG: hypothetical protein IPK75_18240 [Acidobacteria bacterium]|nr:hypothetical protein [Acidobacteriota bacterium]